MGSCVLDRSSRKRIHSSIPTPSGGGGARTGPRHGGSTAGRVPCRANRHEAPSQFRYRPRAPRATQHPAWPPTRSPSRARARGTRGDRKSTRLNSSHVAISYAVFCLKKKNTYHELHRWTDTTKGDGSAV